MANSVFAGLGGINVAGIWKSVYLAGTILFWGIIAIVIIFVVIYFLRFNKKILLVEKTGGNRMRFKFDKGRRDVKKKEFKALSHRNIIFEYPSTEDEYPMGRGSVIPFVVVDGQAATIKGISDNPHFLPANINMFNQLVTRLKQNYTLTRPKQSFWEKYGQSIILATMCVVFLISLILILKRVDKAIDMGQQVISWSIEKGSQVVTN